MSFNPADYYLNSNQDHTWSGSQDYNPNEKVISDEIKEIIGNFKVDVVHLTLHNYGKTGYIEKEYINRGKNHREAFPRLNTQMVKSFYYKVPNTNKGRYLE